MTDEGITWRKPGDVRTKILELVRQYNDAKDWLAQTGQGIEGVDEEDTKNKINGEHSLL